MATFLLILSLFLAIFSGVLCWQVIEQRKIIVQMLENDHISNFDKEPDLVLTLKVLNPIAVAKRESRSARVLADKLPVMVRKMVYQGVMKELEEELVDRGIDVEMNIEYR